MAGIDQQIQTKVDAYRNNPQALQQRYQQNQELLDLLALQKLKSEKDAAARDIQMQMEQSPQTIRQQRERELVDRTKQQMTEQTTGIMQQRQAQQQKNVQKVAKQGAASPQALQGVQKGLGSLASQVAPQSNQMAAGGIVGYAAGELVTEDGITAEDIAAYRAYFKKKNPGVTAELTDAQIRTQLVALAQGSGGNAGVLAEPPKEPVAEAPQAPIVPKMEAPQAPKEAPLGSVGTQQAPQAPKEAPQAPKEEGLGGGIPTLVAPETDYSTVGDRGKALVKDVGLGSLGTAADAETAARASSDEYLGRTEKADKFGELSGRLAEYDARMNDPDKLRRERTSAFLRNAGGTSGFGSTMASASQGMANTRIAQEKGERTRLMDAIKLEETAIASDYGIGLAGSELGQAKAKQVDDNKQAVLNAMSNMDNADLQALRSEADRQLAADGGNQKAAIATMTAQVQKDLQTAIQNQSGAAGVMQLKIQLTDQMAAFADAEFANDEVFQSLLAKAAQSGDESDRKAAEDRQRDIMVAINYKLRPMTNIMTQLDKQGELYGLETLPTGGEGAGGGTLDSEIEDLVNTYSGATSGATNSETDDALNAEIDAQIMENGAADAPAMSNAGTTSDAQLREMEPMVRNSVSTLGVDAVNAKLAPAGLFWDGKKLTRMG